MMRVYGYRIPFTTDPAGGSWLGEVCKRSRYSVKPRDGPVKAVDMTVRDTTTDDSDPPQWEPGKVVTWTEPLEERVAELERLLKLSDLRFRREAECASVNMEENDKRFIGLEHEVKSLRRRLLALGERADA